MNAVNIPSTFFDFSEQDDELLSDIVSAECTVQQMLHASILCTQELIIEQPGDALLFETSHQMTESFYRFDMKAVDVVYKDGESDLLT